MTTSISCCARPGAEGVAVIGPVRDQAGQGRVGLGFHIGLQVGPQARPDAPVMPGRLAAIDRGPLPVLGRPRAWRALRAIQYSASTQRRPRASLPTRRPKQVSSKERIGAYGSSGGRPWGTRKGRDSQEDNAGSQAVQSTSTLPRSRRQRRLAAGRVARLRDARPLKTHCTLPRLLAVQALSFTLLPKAYEREGQTVTAIPSPPHPMNFVYVAAE